jgi:hypothetical protein
MNVTRISEAPTGFWRSYAPAGAPRSFGSRFLRRLIRERPVLLDRRWQVALDRVVFLVIGVILLVYFPVQLLISSSTTTGGDTGAHIYTPWYLRYHLLPRGQISGWAPGWYAGFPMLQFYFPLISLFQAFLSFVVPYEVAFKLGTVLGTFFLPVAAYVLFRLVRFPWPTPALGALAAVGFLFMTSYSIYGGNIPSSLSGEYGFSLSLGLSLVFLGLLYRLATEEKGRPLLAASMLALAVLSHLLPVIVAVLLSPLLLFWALREHGARRALTRFGSVFALSFALTGFWSIPFLVRLPYTTDMRWYPLKGWGPVFPKELIFYLGGMALAGAVMVLRRDRRPLLFYLMAVLGIVLYLFLPPGSVWNGRFLPFYYLAAFLCTAYFAGVAFTATARWISVRRIGHVTLGISLFAAVVMGAWALRQKEPSYIDNWIHDNYAGYESRADFPTFKALNDRVAQLPPGRIFWEPNDGLVKFGTPIALMSLPYWSGQPTMEGINFESSMTTPFHFLTASEVALKPSNPIPGLPYKPMDLARGARHMELLDVRYYLSFTEEARNAAVEAGLEKLDDVGEFSIFAVDSPGQVVIPPNAPVPVNIRGSRWIERNIEWFGDLEALDTPLVRASKEEWDRILPGNAGAPASGGTSVEARIQDDEISFTTDAIGQPHWVKTSYFPNWKVEGARGPYLASPSTMIVIPTQKEVRLYYSWTWTEWTGYLLTLAGLAVLVVRPLRRRWSALGSAGPHPEGTNLGRRLRRGKKDAVSEGGADGGGEEQRLGAPDG